VKSSEGASTDFTGWMRRPLWRLNTCSFSSWRERWRQANGDCGERPESGLKRQCVPCTPAANHGGWQQKKLHLGYLSAPPAADGIGAPTGRRGDSPVQRFGRMIREKAPTAKGEPRAPNIRADHIPSADAHVAALAGGAPLK